MNEAQKRYVDSQIRLFFEICGRVNEINTEYPQSVSRVDVARTIYRGYVLSDLTDEVARLIEELEEINEA